MVKLQYDDELELELNDDDASGFAPTLRPAVRYREPVIHNENGGWADTLSEPITVDAYFRIVSKRRRF